MEATGIKKLILNWLLGVDAAPDYLDLLDEVIRERRQHIEDLEDHQKTLEAYGAALDRIIKLIKVCEKHGIDVDAETECL